jgi:hypothetical protein
MSSAVKPSGSESALRFASSSETSSAAPRTLVVAAVAASSSAARVRLERWSSVGQRLDLLLELVEDPGLLGDAGVALHDELRQVTVGAQVTALGGLEAHREHQARCTHDDRDEQGPGEPAPRTRCRDRGPARGLVRGHGGGVGGWVRRLGRLDRLCLLGRLVVLAVLLHG